MIDEIRDQTEVLVVDAPAGASDSSIAFLAAADHVVVVLVGEPTSFLDAYALIKAANIESGVTQFSIVVNMRVLSAKPTPILINSNRQHRAFWM